MRRLLVSVTAIGAGVSAQAGFWDALDKVQKTVNTVKAVGEVIDGSRNVNVQTPTQQVQTRVQQPQATAALSSAAASAAVSEATPAELAVFAGSRTTAADTAVPEIKYGTVYVKKPATPEQISEAKAAWLNGGKRLDNLSIRFENVDDATLAATLAAFPQAKSVNLNKSPAVTTLAPFTLLRHVQAIYLDKAPATDLKPLAGLAKLKTLSLKYSTVGDMAPLATLVSLEDLDLYGATLASGFTPLAGCPKLKKVCYYATKMEPALYDTLGDLKQVKKFDGGLTKMTSLAWLRRVPGAEEVQVFAEKVEDYEAIGTVTALKKVRLWNLCGDRMSTKAGDLRYLATCRNLEVVELPGSDYSNLEVLGTLPKLREISLNGATQPIDLTFLKATPNVTRLTISKPKAAVTGFETIATLANLESLDIQQIPGVVSIAPLAACTKLKELIVSKGVYPASETDALDALIKKNNRYGKIRLY